MKSKVARRCLLQINLCGSKAPFCYNLKKIEKNFLLCLKCFFFLFPKLKMFLSVLCVAYFLWAYYLLRLPETFLFYMCTYTICENRSFLFSLDLLMISFYFI